MIYKTSGVIVLGHGSKVGLGDANSVVSQIADMLKTRLGHDLVEAAYVTADAGGQTLWQAACKLVERGVRQIIVTPMFLTDGVHTQRGIPADLENIRRMLPGIQFILARHIGPDLRIADILYDRMQAALLSITGEEG